MEVSDPSPTLNEEVVPNTGAAKESPRRITGTPVQAHLTAEVNVNPSVQPSPAPVSAAPIADAVKPPPKIPRKRKPKAPRDETAPRVPLTGTYL